MSTEDPLIGATVRYIEPGTLKMRIGTVDHRISRGKQKGWYVVKCAARGHRKSTVPFHQITVLRRSPTCP